MCVRRPNLLPLVCRTGVSLLNGCRSLWFMKIEMDMVPASRRTLILALVDFSGNLWPYRSNGGSFPPSTPQFLLVWGKTNLSEEKVERGGRVAPGNGTSLYSDAGNKMNKLEQMMDLSLIDNHHQYKVKGKESRNVRDIAEGSATPFFSALLPALVVCDKPTSQCVPLWCAS